MNLLELLFIAVFGVVMFFITKTFLWVLVYFVVYKVIAMVAYMLIGGIVNLDGPVVFLISRAIFLLLTLKIGNRIWEFVKRFKLANVIVILLFIWVVYSAAVDPPQDYYYHQYPDSEITNYI